MQFKANKKGVRASTRAMPPAHALKKIINTIKYSLKSIIKHSHLEAVQWGKQKATASKSQKTTPKAAAAARVTLNAPSRTQRDQLCPFHAAPSRSQGSCPQDHIHTDNMCLAHQGSYWGRSKQFLAPPPRLNGFIFSQAKAGSGTSTVQAAAAASSWSRPRQSYSILYFFKLQCIRVHIPE